MHLTLEQKLACLANSPNCLIREENGEDYTQHYNIFLSGNIKVRIKLSLKIPVLSGKMKENIIFRLTRPCPRHNEIINFSTTKASRLLDPLP